MALIGERRVCRHRPVGIFGDPLRRHLDLAEPGTLAPVVVLSSVGSERASGFGDITETNLLEQARAAFDLPLAIVRTGALLENTLLGL